MTQLLKSPFYPVALLFIITIAIYISSLSHVFFSQEVISLDDNSVLNTLLNEGITLHDVLRPGWQGKYYRPVTDLSFFVEQYLWGGQPFGYRLTNVLIHAFNSMLVYLFAKRLLNFVCLKSIE